ncbi:putative sugar O-methyltransferase [Leptospira levettii]|uniref:Sugar O-methyltransferase n=1 Tax=Leptospira levettii TaxID=2023178 RepID=A0ABY2MRR7_9LEPT|nr:putative sugar O-methyltransferase [Leptospira levettii]TGL73613.1 putative sugar O-methyltransferase [Leptospira levettii]TGM82670.1 putative sugar O-methyltransferase [Leptospira levettii]
MYKLNLDPKNIERLNHFKNSDYFLSTNSKSKSSYWKEHSKLLKSEVTKDKMVVSGDSGFYIPPENQPILEIFSKITKILKSPSKLIQRVKNRFFTLPKLFQYKTAFDLVLNHDVVTDPDLSPYRINHLLWKKENDLFLSSDAVKSDFENWSKRKISEHIYLHYYYFNILKSFLKGKKVKTVLEIGAGNGNLTSILFKNFPGISLILVDLPEMIPVSFSYLSSVFPDAKIILPNEIFKNGPKDYDILLLTTDQIKLIQDRSIDLVINCHSFQEMPNTQITNYFKLIERVIKKGGHFFTANRIEKIPVSDIAFTKEQSDLPNRFHLYPWNKNAKVLVNEVSRFSRLVQLDGIGIRLEITKP